MTEDTPQRLAKRLEAEGQKTQEFFHSLADEDWERCVHTDGAQWTVRQVLAHFVGAEAGMNDLIRNIMGGGVGTPADFNLDQYNQRRVDRLQAATPDDLLAQYIEHRQASIQMVANLTTDDLQLAGRHPWLGVATVEEIVKMLYRHNQIHQREIRQALSAARV